VLVRVNDLFDKGPKTSWYWGASCLPVLIRFGVYQTLVLTTY